jgi:hypothetical protein
MQEEIILEIILKLFEIILKLFIFSSGLPVIHPTQRRGRHQRLAYALDLLAPPR